MTLLSVTFLLAAMTTQDAVVTVLNSPSASSARRFAEAQELLLREAKDGKPLQQFVIGVTTKDADLAKTYLDASRDKIRHLAEKRNNPLAWYLLSLEKNDFECLKKAVEGGNVQALNACGTILLERASVEGFSSTNAIASAVSRGYACFHEAAARGDPNGFVNLGTCYLRGLGCPVNLSLAHECFKSAALAGHPDAMDYVSADYQLGHGVAKDPELSLVWRMKAKALRGDEAAAEWLRTGEKKKK